jgi:hypothetical protein
MPQALQTLGKMPPHDAFVFDDQNLCALHAFSFSFS